MELPGLRFSAAVRQVFKQSNYLQLGDYWDFTNHELFNDVDVIVDSMSQECAAAEVDTATMKRAVNALYDHLQSTHLPLRLSFVHSYHMLPASSSVAGEGSTVGGGALASRTPLPWPCLAR